MQLIEEKFELFLKISVLKKKKENKKLILKKYWLILVKEIPRLETSVNYLRAHLLILSASHPHPMERF